MQDLTKEEIEECESLDNWLDDVSCKEIDATLEWLDDAQYLNQEGKKFLTRYWQHCWHDDKKPKEVD